jgi:hypothetical protein
MEGSTEHKQVVTGLISAKDAVSDGDVISLEFGFATGEMAVFVELIVVAGFDILCSDR